MSETILIQIRITYMDSDKIRQQLQWAHSARGRAHPTAINALLWR